ncbi:hypothetical protein, partial [Bacillus smithii]|uniref:hypothetical protein n=1 Tax=Bacillus smithii TaxID=1479 RepID=UPI0030C9FF49
MALRIMRIPKFFYRDQRSNRKEEFTHLIEKEQGKLNQIPFIITEQEIYIDLITGFKYCRII